MRGGRQDGDQLAQLDRRAGGVGRGLAVPEVEAFGELVELGLQRIDR
ncbi:hypothetical protein [Sphaerisporangium fuscum]|nr:hypothetical protein [Sphaerisporangium fuscum]